MVLEFYNLREQPFGVTPDPRYLYLSATHREAMASLEYGITSGRGFLGLIAPPGMGKTTILFHLLQKLGTHARSVFIFQTHGTPRDFLRNLMTDLGLDDCGGDVPAMQAKLNEMLLEEARAGKRVIVVVDEAQNLEEPVLELLRMLSNFETASEKLIQIVLSGQTQLAERLAAPSLVQLRQRISIMGRLAPFDQQETERYINHRLEIAGFDREMPLFTRQAYRWIAEASGGIPRNINNICFNALSLGCVNQQRMIPADTIQEVVKDLDFAEVRKLPSPAVSLPANPALSAHSREAGQAFAKRGFVRGWLTRFAAAAVVLALAVVGIASIERNSRNRWHNEQNPTRKTENHAAPAVPVTIPSNVAPAPAANPIPAAPMTVPAAPIEASPSAAPVPATKAAPVEPRKLQVPTRAIRVGQDQTLYSISMKNLGTFDKQSVQTIQALNPWLTNPDHIVAGQTIRIPKTKKKQDQMNDGIESIAEAAKP